MKITDSGAHLSPWRRRVLPVMMMALRALVAWLVLRVPLDTLVHNALFLRGLGPAWLGHVAAALLVAGALAFVWSRSVLWGALVLVVGLYVYEQRWHAVVPGQSGKALATSVLLILVLAAGEWLARRAQARIYGSVSR